MSQRPVPTAAEILARATILESASTDATDGEAEVTVLADLAAGTATVADLDDAALEDLVARHGIDAVLGAVLSAPVPSASAVSPPVTGDLDRAGTDDRPVLPFQTARAKRRMPSTRWLAVAAAACLVTALAWALVWRSGEAPVEQTARHDVDHGEKRTPPESGVAPATTTARKTVLILVRGDDRARVQQGEDVLSKTAAERFGLQSPPPAVVSSLRQDRGVIDAALRGDVPTLADIARRNGLDAIVVGDIHPGTASTPARDEPLEKVSLKLYRAGEGESLVSRDIVVGRDFASTIEAATEAEIRAMATREAMTRTATALRDWLQRWNPSQPQGPRR